MHKRCSTHQNILKVLIFVAAIATFYYVEAQMSMIQTTKECNNCLKAGHVACKKTTDVSKGVCCNPNGIDIEQCSAKEDSSNFAFCSSDVNSPSSIAYACPYQDKSCFWQPCKGMVADVDKDCTFDNPKMVKQCQDADETENWE